MIKAIVLAGSMAALTLGSAPARADDVTVERRTTTVVPVPVPDRVIIRERTGTIDDDCVTKKKTSENLATGERETRTKTRCD